MTAKMLLHHHQHSNNNHFSEPIQASIWHCLNNYAYEDAIFLAERLNAEGVSDDCEEGSLQLLATAYYRSNNKLQCYDLLRNKFKATNNLNYKSRLLLATVALDLNKLSESERYLCGSSNRVLDSLVQSYFEISCFALKLFGKICLLTDRTSLAKDAFQKSLLINPLLWDSYQLLCSLNNNIEPKHIFQMSGLEYSNLQGHDDKFNTPPQQQQQQQQKQEQNVVKECVGILHPRNPRNNNNNNNNNNRCGRNLFTSTPMNNFNNSFNSTLGVTPLQGPPLAHAHSNAAPVLAPLVGGMGGASSPPPLSLTPTLSDSLIDSVSPIIIDTNEPRPKKPCLRVQSNWQQNNNQQALVRRSTRLTPTPATTTTHHLKENNKSQSSIRQAPNTITSPINQPGNKRRGKQIQVDFEPRHFEWVLSVYREVGEAYLSLTRYECQDAINKLTNLKPSQQNTPWVLAHIAKAFFELADYEQAIRYYKRMRELCPNRLCGLEWMSTALWHLQKEVELSVLAQDLLSEQDNKTRPQTWIVLGNCFSLQKEHEQAIKFFKRAIQVNNKLAYAYTLLGHEYVTTEELEKALRCFRSASRLDPTHYNSWYGMGMIYYKQERYTQAQIYYQKAIKIHPNNSVLLCHLGVVQNALNETEKSLLTFTSALRLNPSDPLCKFHRASVLFAVNRLDEALDELLQLKRIVPKESLVHFLIAKIYSKKGCTHKALLHFSWATDLDPKGANNHIKESIEPVLSRSNATSNNFDNNNIIDELESDLTL